jgi:hypothetical protein
MLISALDVVIGFPLSIGVTEDTISRRGKEKDP